MAKMNITDVVEEQRKLSDTEVREIIRKNAVHFSHIDCNLSQTLPSLVAYVLDLAKRRKQIYVLSNFYPRELPTRDGERIMNYEANYLCDENGISIGAFDPTSDAMDPGESYTKQVPVEEFLMWTMNDRVHTIDVYQHIQAALRQKKDISEAHQKHFEEYV